ncbi:PLP-dependent aminotransferase family protein [Clostridium saccharoperbutylacetonicum]|uniref:aminotransferase-like domain-containing protein n=1 Tax=Clostridium saccharoperbutylacetonicum TaxID=36745 RepID=UPI00156E9E35|nr:PLP-dependent aminotransferase family protein [Clostridium saccharoperbutylacetonicum]NSB33642.1 DNA-binding transcriptional MocR family regulator [Clostridium saccharoperbutylacetonicum]
MSKYEAIINFINYEINNKNITYGEKMPTIRELSEKFNCSKQTVVHAYEIMQKNHIIYSRPQSGYYLIDKKELYINDFNKIIDFSSGSPDESILDYKEFQHCLNQAIEIHKATLFNYSSPKGLPDLIFTLKTYFENYQIFCSLDDIYITSGSQQAINILCSMPFPNGKSNVLVEQPTYHGTLKALETTKTPIIGIERKFDSLDLKELEKKFAYGNIKCFYTIPRFSNPLGISYTNNEKKQIIMLAEKYDVYIVEDDYLADLEIKNNSYPMYYTDTSSKVIYIKSFSKILLPGLRIAAVVLPKLLRNTFEEYKKWTDLNTSVLSQGALDIYIKSGIFNSNNKTIRTTYSERMDALRKVSSEIILPQIKWNIPDTGFYSCIEFLNNINIDWLIKECDKKDILIKGMDNAYLKDYFNGDILKISVGNCSTSDIENGIHELLKIIQIYYNNI